MLKKLPVLLVLSALCMWAADFWTTKPFTDWDDKEVGKIISNSPWAAKVTIAGGVAGGAPGIAETAGSGRGSRGGGGGGGGGRGGASSPQGDGANADPGNGGGDFGGGGISVTLFWQTAMPIRQALVKRQYGAEAGTSAEAKARLERVEQVYVLTVFGLPGYALAATQGDRKAILLDTTTLTVAGKPPLKPTDVQVSSGRGTGNVSFLFPKTTTFTVEDKEVEFASKFGGTPIKHKFKLKDMVFNGKVEM